MGRDGWERPVRPREFEDFWCSKAEDRLEYNLYLFPRVAVHLGALSFLSSGTCPHILALLNIIYFSNAKTMFYYPLSKMASCPELKSQGFPRDVEQLSCSPHGERSLVAFVSAGRGGCVGGGN